MDIIKELKKLIPTKTNNVVIHGFLQLTRGKVETFILKALKDQKKEIIKTIDESFWQCPIHEKLQMDGSCKECNQCLEVNVILNDIINKLT